VRIATNIVKLQLVDSFCRDAEDSFLDYRVAAQPVSGCEGFLSLLRSSIDAKASLALIVVANEKNVYSHS
jgi:hypothetical protein